MVRCRNSSHSPWWTWFSAGGDYDSIATLDVPTTEGEVRIQLCKIPLVSDDGYTVDDNELYVPALSAVPRC